MANNQTPKLQDMISVLLEELQKHENVALQQQEANEVIQSLIKELYDYQPKLDTSNLKIIFDEHKRAIEIYKLKIEDINSIHIEKIATLKEKSNLSSTTILYGIYLLFLLYVISVFVLFKMYKINIENNEILYYLKSQINHK